MKLTHALAAGAFLLTPLAGVAHAQYSLQPEYLGPYTCSGIYDVAGAPFQYPDCGYRNKNNFATINLSGPTVAATGCQLESTYLSDADVPTFSWAEFAPPSLPYGNEFMTSLILGACQKVTKGNLADIAIGQLVANVDYEPLQTGPASIGGDGQYCSATTQQLRNGGIVETVTCNYSAIVEYYSLDGTVEIEPWCSPQPNCSNVATPVTVTWFFVSVLGEDVYPWNFGPVDITVNSPASLELQMLYGD